MRRPLISILLCLLWLGQGVGAEEEKELYRAWQDPVNTRELSVQTLGMVVLIAGLFVWRKWARRIR